MESKKPMDRLVCGDVGFGKTEVAMRAAFKAAIDGHQVALLAPTTILASQHYVTFKERMAKEKIRTVRQDIKELDNLVMSDEELKLFRIGACFLGMFAALAVITLLAFMGAR